MSAEIIVASIGAVATIASVVISTMHSSKALKTEVSNQLITAQAVTNTKLENLTAEVQKHNNFAVRIPVVESQVQSIYHQMDDMKHDIDALQRK